MDKSEKNLDMLFKLRKQQFKLEEDLEKSLGWIERLCMIKRHLRIKAEIRRIRKKIDWSKFTFLGKPLM